MSTEQQTALSSFGPRDRDHGEREQELITIPESVGTWLHRCENGHTCPNCELPTARARLAYHYRDVCPCVDRSHPLED